MSDERLRSLERRWRESGSVADEAALLRERVRVGALEEAKLTLAAHCGLPGAIEALVGRDWMPPAPSWPAGLASWGEEVCLRALLMFLRPLPSSEETRLQVDIFVESGLSPADARACLVELVNALEACVETRADVDRRRVEAAVEQISTRNLHYLSWVWVCSDAMRALGRGEEATAPSCHALEELARQVGGNLVLSAARELGRWALR